MEAVYPAEYGPSDVLQLNDLERPKPKEGETNEAYTELEQTMRHVLETYSNVHRPYVCSCISFREFIN